MEYNWTSFTKRVNIKFFMVNMKSVLENGYDLWNKNEHLKNVITAWYMAYNKKLADRIREIISLTHKNIMEKAMFWGFASW